MVVLRSSWNINFYEIYIIISRNVVRLKKKADRPLVSDHYKVIKSKSVMFSEKSVLN